MRLSGGMSSLQLKFPGIAGRFVPCIQMITLPCSEKFIEDILSDFVEVLVGSCGENRKRDLPLWLGAILFEEQDENTKRKIKVKTIFLFILNNQLFLL